MIEMFPLFLFQPVCSNLPLGAVERIPDTSDTLVQRLDRLGDLPQLLAAGIAKQKGLFQYLSVVEVSHTYGLLAAVDVGALDDGVFPWSWRDGDFDLWVLLCE